MTGRNRKLAAFTDERILGDTVLVAPIIILLWKGRTHSSPCCMICFKSHNGRIVARANSRYKRTVMIRQSLAENRWLSGLRVAEPWMPITDSKYEVGRVEYYP